MRGVGTVFKKEMRAYFMSPIPYVVIALFSALIAWQFFGERNFWIMNKASLEAGFFFRLEYVLIVLVPLISMRLWSEEVRAGTIESLMTAPISSMALVIGKFLAAWAVLAICLLGTAGLAITATSLGDLDWGPVMGGYLGALLLCGALLAIGIWVSSFTAHQLVAFIVTALIGLLFIVMQEAASSAGTRWGPVLDQLSLTAHFQALGRGVVDVRDVSYFASVIVLFLYMNVQSIENRRYR